MEPILPFEFQLLLSRLDLKFPLGKFEVAVAVSGGADSMALVLLTDEWCRSQGHKLIALTIDHRLRPESKDEAAKVHEWLMGRGINHQILVWEHEKIFSRIQERAREARYALLEEWCKSQGIPILMTAHHQCDQGETFLMRMSKGSGIRGLCGILPCVQRSFGFLVRPLLTISPERMRKTLERFGCFHLEDPSNHDMRYERIRWRKALSLFTEKGLTPLSIQKVIERLILAEDALEVETQRIFPIAWTTHLFEEDPHLDLAFLATLSQEIAHRVLTKVIASVQRKPHPLRHKSLSRLYATLLSPCFVGTTAGGCYFKRKKGNRILVRREEERYKNPGTLEG